MKKECVICNEEFEARNKIQLICGKECRRLYSNKKSKEYRLKHGPEINAKRLIQRRSKAKPMYEYPPKNCLHCGNTYQPPKNNWRRAKYCSKLCCSRADTEENKKLRWKSRTEITCRECGIIAIPKKIDGVTCGDSLCVKESRRKQRIKHSMEVCKKGGHRYEKVRAYQRKYAKQRRRTDPMFTLNSRISAGMRYSLQNKNELKSFDILDFDLDQLYNRFELLFTQPKWNGYEWVENTNKYSWENIGEWHIDHIRPIASFNFTTPTCEDFKKCWALNNLQPLWASENKSKGDKWDGVVNA